MYCVFCRTLWRWEKQTRKPLNSFGKSSMKLWGKVGPPKSTGWLTMWLTLPNPSKSTHLNWSQEIEYFYLSSYKYVMTSCGTLLIWNVLTGEEICSSTPVLTALGYQPCLDIVESDVIVLKKGTKRISIVTSIKRTLKCPCGSNRDVLDRVIFVLWSDDAGFGFSDYVTQCTGTFENGPITAQVFKKCILWDQSDSLTAQESFSLYEFFLYVPDYFIMMNYLQNTGFLL